MMCLVALSATVSLISATASDHERKKIFVHLFCFYHSDALFGQRPETLLRRAALIAVNSGRSVQTQMA